MMERVMRKAWVFIHRKELSAGFLLWIERLKAAAPNNAGLGLIEMIIIISFFAALAALFLPRAVNAQEMHVTCYCPESCPGTVTYSGVKVREGIAAVADGHIGDFAAVYTVDGEYIGGFECLDRIGTGKETVIDIWKPDLKSAKELMAKTGGRVQVYFIERPEG